MSNSVQLELPFTLEDWGGIHDALHAIDAVYLDQAPINGFVFSCHTPYGIQTIDSEFMERIMAFQNKRTMKELRAAAKEELEERLYKTLRKEIQENEHLHSCIKYNLIGNLDRIWNEREEAAV